MIRALQRDLGLSLSAGALLLLALACGRARGPKIDSESHFLGQCGTSCADGLSCICGVCTVACVDTADCSGASGAQCQELDTAQCGSAVPAACDVACASDTDCAGVPGASCTGGWCRGPDSSGALGVGPSEGGSAPPGTNELSAGLPIATPLADCTSTVGRGVVAQADLARFEGCQTIYGDLDIAFSVDLRPLHALRTLMGNLYIHPVPGDVQGSLEGLENLELVSGNLELNSLALPSLASLARLRTIGTAPGKGLKLSQISGFADLSGLERLENLRILDIADAPDLVSIEALRLPSAIEELMLGSVPRLVSADPLRSVREVENLGLFSTGFVQLNMLAGLRRVGSLTLSGNALLSDASALASLETLRALQLIQNSRLTTFALPQVAELESLWLDSNLSLESLTGLDHLVSLPTLYVNDNPALGGLSLPRLETLQNLDVWHNSRLTTLALPLLSQPIQELLVVSNGALSAESLRPLLDSAKKAKVGGNQGEPIGLDPCPWIRDHYCDALPVDTLCAAGTDAADCRNVGYEPPH